MTSLNVINKQLHKFLEEREIQPTHFVTLIFNKTVKESQCEMGYIKFIKMLNRRIYGQHIKRIRIKEITVMESSGKGYFHLHILLDLNNCDVELYKKEIKDIWSKYLKVDGRNVGSRECFSHFKGIEIKQWFQPVYDLIGVVGYMTKNFEIKDLRGIIKGKLLVV
jgi:hypothetical protein